MGFRFRRSLKIAPGIRLNFSKSGVSTSFGGRGATFNVGSRGTRTTVGLPGTGLSWSTSNSHNPRSNPTSLMSGQQPKTSRAGWIWVAVVLALLALIGTCTSRTPSSVPQSQRTALASTADKTAVVSVRNANCRSSASPTASVVASEARGDKVAVLEELSGWSRVSSSGHDCWIKSSLLGEPGSSLTLPVPAADASAATTAGLGLVSSSSLHRGSTPKRHHRARISSDSDCPCSAGNVCIGPRGGRYCMTSGGNKRYGV